jgi:hypothetical protein
MWTIVRSLYRTAGELFPTRRDRLVVLGLVLLAAAVSVAELATAQIFATIILPDQPRDASEVAFLAAAFFAAFAVLRLVNYAQSVYRINVFEKAFAREEQPARHKDSWRWATAIELVSILTQVSRLIAIALAVVVLTPLFGLVNLVVAVAVLEVLGLAVRRQDVTQREFLEQQRNRTPASTAERVRARIRAGERGSLIASLGIMALFGVLIAQTVTGRVDPGAAFVVFLAVRMEG